MAATKKIDVIVAGAGPVGLTSALSLAERGVSVELIDEQWRSASRSYALALHPSSLERLEALGVAESLIRRGSKVGAIAFYDGTERAGAISLGELETPFPYVLVLPQSALEETLVEELAQRGVSVRWNRRLAWLHLDEDLPTAEVETLEKESAGYGIAKTEWVVQSVRNTRASFVVGADGHQSVVRRDLDIPFRTLAEAQSYAVFEFSADFDVEDEVRVILSEVGASVLWPLGGGRYRFGFALPENALLRRHAKSRLFVHVGDESFPHLGIEHLRKLIDERAPWFGAEVKEVRWAIGVRFETRLATRFGAHRTWIAGDAAHLASPVGVHSMNRGIEEACAYAEAMGDVLRKGKSPDGLEAVGERLFEAWQSLQDEPQSAGDAPAWAKKWASRIPSCIPASGKIMQALLGQVGLSLRE